MTERSNDRNNDDLTLATLGGAALLLKDVNGASITVVPPGKPLALLVYLACSPGHSATREHLIEMLWSHLGTAEARHSLRQSLWQIRRRTSDSLITTDGEIVHLAARLRTDRDVFLAHVEHQEFEEAVAAYTGDFLTNFATPGGLQFEHWAEGERRHLATTFLRCAEIVARRWLSAGRAREAVALARRARDSDPLAEGGWRLLLEALVSAGDRVGATTEADRLEALLSDEDREPEPATVGALRIARKTAVPAKPSGAPALTGELVGREREFAAILTEWDKVRARGRHVSVVASAGLGKTRILGDVAARLIASRAAVTQARAFRGDRELPYSFIANVTAALSELPGAAGISAESARTLVALNPQIPLALSGPPDTTEGAEALRRRTMALTELVAAVSEERRVALLLDDCQWADERSMSILRTLIENAGQHRILLVTASRPHTAATLAGRDSLTLVLDPLDGMQINALLASIAALPTEQWAELFHEELARVTGGSPLLILETLQLLTDRGTLELVDGRWNARSGDQLLASLHAGGALTMRVTTLVPTERELLALLAVAGAPAPTSVLTHAAPAVADLPQLMEDMESRGLVEHTTRGWQVAHDEIGFAALETLGRGELYEVHVRIGLALARDDAADDATLKRAAAHLAIANAHEGLISLAHRWMAERRARGYLRPARVLLKELLGGKRDLAPSIAKQLPWRLRVDRRPLVVGSAAGVAIALVVAVAIGLASDDSPPEGRLIIAPAERPGMLLHAALDPGSLRRVGVARLEPLPRKDPLRPMLPPTGAGGVVDPLGRFVAYSWPSGDAGGIDLYLRDASGRERRLTHSPRDDVAPSWSPDGSRIAFGSARWDPVRMRNQVAVIDVETGAVRRLTSNTHVDGPPFWSPFGSRIAFFRNRFDLQPAELCWVAVDGRRERCVVPSVGRLLQVAGWTSPRAVLALLEVDGTQRMAIVELRSGAVRMLDLPPATTLSPVHDTEWLICDCAHETRRSGLSLVHIPSETSFLLDQAGNDLGRGLGIVWAPNSGSSAWIQSVDIAVPATGVPLGGRVRLIASGRSPNGAPLPLPPSVIAWAVRDTSIAVIDSLGYVRGLRRGVTMVTASAGGWRTGSATLLVSGMTSTGALREDWSRNLDLNWDPFGTPAPTIIEADRGRAMATNGNGVYPSGVTSRESWPGLRGVGVEVALSTPLTQMQWQRIVVAFESVSADKSRSWDRALGALPNGGSSCAAAYPAGEGSLGIDRLRFQQRSVAMEPRLRSGEWYTVRVQLFPDGRCGLAVDGQPVAITESRGTVAGNYQLQIFGDMVGTRILVGPIDVWTGVRDGVDWSLLDDSTAPR